MAETDAEDDWTAAALADDALVAWALLTLSALPAPAAAGRVAELRWGVTQRRSRLGRGAAPEEKKEGAAGDGGRRQGSPTTPLSWSDGTSPSGGDGCDVAEADAARPLKRKHKVPSFHHPRGRNKNESLFLGCLMLEKMSGVEGAALSLVSVLSFPFSLHNNSYEV